MPVVFTFKNSLLHITGDQTLYLGGSKTEDKTV